MKYVAAVKWCALVFAVVAFGAGASSVGGPIIPPVPKAIHPNGFDDLVKAADILSKLLCRDKGAHHRPECMDPQQWNAPLWIFAHYFREPDLPRLPESDMTKVTGKDRPALLAQAMQDSGPVFAGIRNALAKHIVHPPVKRVADLASNMPDYGALRNLGKWLGLKAHWERETEHDSDAVADWAEGLKMGTAIANGAPLIGNLVSQTLMRLALNEIATGLPDLKPRDLARMEEALISADSTWSDVGNSLLVERDYTLRTWEKERRTLMAASAGEGGPSAVTGETADDRTAREELVDHWAGTVQEMYTVFDDYVRACRAPFSKRANLFPKEPKSALLSIALPNYPKACEKQDELRAAIRILALTAAAERVKRERGKYPVTLGDLMKADKSLTKQVTTDPFTGDPLLVRVVDGKFLAYSRGFDGVDDGGRAMTPPLDPSAKGDLTLDSLAPHPLISEP